MALVVAFDLESAAAFEAFGGILDGWQRRRSKMQGKGGCKGGGSGQAGRWVGGEVRLVKGLRVAEKSCASEQASVRDNNSCQARWRNGQQGDEDENLPVTGWIGD